MARTLVGVVASDKTDKTIVINVAERKTHPLYKKQYTVNTKFMAHDEKNEAKVGDRVAVVECRPLSARKRFTLSKVLDRANVGFEEKDATADVAEETPEEKK
jgi:small subunit ribosomal protein S17